MYLGKSSCISYQNTVDQEQLSLNSIKHSEDPQLIEPPYKTVIKPALIRRMSGVLKMGTYTAMQCLGDHKESKAIIVGTGLGCVRDTLSFLDQTIKNDEQTLAPTAFIQSTHNSIGGQIALLLGNYHYNMTMVQNSLSFEMALLDAELQLELENLDQVLVGGVDELTSELQSLLEKLVEKLGLPLPQLGQGSAFFHATRNPDESSVAKIQFIKTFSNFDGDPLKKVGINLENYDLILNGGYEGQLLPEGTDVIDFKEYCGEYLTASAFAVHIALMAMQNKLKGNQKTNTVLILNKFGSNFGIIGLESSDL